MSPTLDGQQELLKVCETYAEAHNLKFSTNENPSKSKTKCMAYSYKNRKLREMVLCGNKLRWVKKGKHLGMGIDAKVNISADEIYPGGPLHPKLQRAGTRVFLHMYLDESVA